MREPASGQKEEYRLLNQAIVFAANAHRFQLDKGEKPYIFHPLRVAMALFEYGDIVMAAGVLHDVVEDTSFTLTDIRTVFGRQVAEIVDAVTKREGETYKEFVTRSAEDPLGRLVKIADIKDNLGRLTPVLKGLEKRYAMALEILGDDRPHED